MICNRHHLASTRFTAACCLLPAARARLAALRAEWHGLLQQWAMHGRLTAAAQEALLLPGEPAALRRLIAQWSAADFSQLPAIALLPSVQIKSGQGAYAISSKTIFLNADWLRAATQPQVLAVLTEELGHRLDGLMIIAMAIRPIRMP